MAKGNRDGTGPDPNCDKQDGSGSKDKKPIRKRRNRKLRNRLLGTPKGE